MEARQHVERCNAGQIAAILSELTKVAQNDPGAYFARFSVPLGQRPWVELSLSPHGVGGLLNMFYPFREPPIERLHQAGLEPLPGMSGGSLFPQACCMLFFTPVASSDLAKFVDNIFVRLFGCQAEQYSVDVDVEVRPVAASKRRAPERP